MHRSYIAIPFLFFAFIVLFPQDAFAQWSKAGDMETPAADQAAFLAGSEALFTGGRNATGALTTTNKYSLIFKSWMPGSNLNYSRYGHCLVTRGGAPLVSGGTDGTTYRGGDQGIESYGAGWSIIEPRHSLFASVRARAFHTIDIWNAPPICQYATGDRVIFVGGYNGTTYINAVDILEWCQHPLETGEHPGNHTDDDPGTGTPEPIARLRDPRAYHTATKYTSTIGTMMLIAGGLGQVEGIGPVVPLPQSELLWLNPADNVTSRMLTATPMKYARFFHAATLLNNGKILIAGGCTSYGTYTGSCELFDPTKNYYRGEWIDADFLNFPRAKHIMITLSNGWVMVAGGENATGVLSSCELFNPTAGKKGAWIYIGDMITERTRAAVTTIGTTPIIAGGWNSGQGYLRSAELFDIGAIGSWAQVKYSKMAVPRRWPSMTLLTTGKVLIACGQKADGSASNDYEIFNPLTGAVEKSGQITGAARYWHSATMLYNGYVLLTGGYASGQYLNSCVVYNPFTDTWTAGANMLNARGFHTLSLLPDGRVLAVGGYNGSNPVAETEIFDPYANKWVTTITIAGKDYPLPPLLTPRYRHTATTAFTGGKPIVIVTGGIDSDGNYEGNTEVLESEKVLWEPVGGLNIYRADHTATLMPNGQVLVIGGNSPQGLLGKCEKYDVASAVWVYAGELVYPVARHSATVQASGRILVAGGYGIGKYGTAGYLVYCQSYNPTTDLPSSTGNLVTKRADHATLILPTGKCITAGGFDGTNVLDTIELYDPTIGGTWSNTGGLATERMAHTATLMGWARAGQAYSGILVAGGRDTYGNYLASWEIHNGLASAAGTYAMFNRRAGHTATSLFNNTILVIGGRNETESLKECEYFSPVTQLWTQTASTLTYARSGHTANLMYDGNILVVGGYRTVRDDIVGYPAVCEYFNSFSETFELAPNYPEAGGVSWHTATLMPDGNVLVVGGGNATGALKTTAVFNYTNYTWTTVGDLKYARYGHSAHLLPNGDLIVVGGVCDTDPARPETWQNYLDKCELYRNSTGTWTELSDVPDPANPGFYLFRGSLWEGKYGHSGTILLDGRIFIIGGINRDGYTTSCEIYDNEVGWIRRSGLTLARDLHAVVFMPDTTVLIIGGRNAQGATSAVERYDRGLGVGGGQPVIYPKDEKHPYGFPPGSNPGRILDDPLVEGETLRGISDASGGNFMASPTYYPVMYFRRFENEFITFEKEWDWASAKRVTMQMPSYYGTYLFFPITNGIPGGGLISLVSPPLKMSKRNPEPGVVNVDYTWQFKVVAGIPPFAWIVEPNKDSLPPGLTLDGETAVLSGTPFVSNYNPGFQFDLQVTDAIGSSERWSGRREPTKTPDAQCVNIKIYPAVQVVDPPPGTTLSADTGGSFSQRFTGIGKPDLLWSIEFVDLNPGLSWTSVEPTSKGIIGPQLLLSGNIPLTENTGRRRFYIRAGHRPYTGSSETVWSDPVEYTLMIYGPPSITTPEGQLPDGEVRAFYTYQFSADGRAPFTWSLVDGSLPAGLELKSDGTLSGSPLQEGLFTFKIKVSSGGGMEASPKTYQVFIQPELVITSAALPPGNKGGPYSFNFTASGGVAPYNWYQIGGTLPTGLNLMLNGTLSGILEQNGTFTFTIAVLDNLGVMKTREYSLTTTAKEKKKEKSLCGLIGIEPLLLLVLLYFLRRREKNGP